MDEWLLWRRVALGICCSVSIKLRSADTRLIQYFDRVPRISGKNINVHANDRQKVFSGDGA